MFSLLIIIGLVSTALAKLLRESALRFRLCSGIALSMLVLNTPALSDTKAQLIWSGLNNDNNSIYLSAWDGERWTKPTSIYQSKNSINNPTLATLSNGTSIAMWSEQQRRKTMLMWAKKPVQSDVWSEASVFSRLGLDNVSPTMVRDALGKLWVFWSAQESEYTDIYMTHQTAGGWSKPKRVNDDNEVPDIKPVASLNDQVEVIISWRSYDFESRAYLQKMRAYPNGDAQGDSIASIDFQSELDLGSIPLPSYGGSQFANLHAPNNHIFQNLRIEPSFRY